MSDQELDPETGSTAVLAQPTGPGDAGQPDQPTGPGDSGQPALIVRTARELAEAEGWDAVTTRRLAERAGCGQSDLYRHFVDREAVVAAVAVDGYADLAAAIRAARTSTVPAAAGADVPLEDCDRSDAGGPPGDSRACLAAVAAVYLDFAYANPACYDAMFTLTPDLSFLPPGAPDALHAAFVELRQSLAPLADGRDLDTFTEIGWSALHGMVMLSRGGRLRPELQEQREAMIVSQLSR